jgi:hypothetical protein
MNEILSLGTENLIYIHDLYGAFIFMKRLTVCGTKMDEDLFMEVKEKPSVVWNLAWKILRGTKADDGKHI